MWMGGEHVCGVCAWGCEGMGGGVMWVCAVMHVRRGEERHLSPDHALIYNLLLRNWLLLFLVFSNLLFHFCFYIALLCLITYFCIVLNAP